MKTIITHVVDWDDSGASANPAILKPLSSPSSLNAFGPLESLSSDRSARPTLRRVYNAACQYPMQKMPAGKRAPQAALSASSPRGLAVRWHGSDSAHVANSSTIAPGFPYTLPDIRKTSAAAGKAMPTFDHLLETKGSPARRSNVGPPRENAPAG